MPFPSAHARSKTSTLQAVLARVRLRAGGHLGRREDVARLVRQVAREVRGLREDPAALDAPAQRLERAIRRARRARVP